MASCLEEIPLDTHVNPLCPLMSYELIADSSWLVAEDTLELPAASCCTPLFRCRLDAVNPLMSYELIADGS
jgi:hypothetical protein